MSYFQKYKLEFDNAEEQVMKVLIEDTFSGDTNPYGLVLDVEIPLIGTDIIPRIYFTSLPPTATDTMIGYSSDGGATWTDTSTGLTSPAMITIPTGVYIYRFIIVCADPADNEIFIMNQMDGVTENLIAGGDPLHQVINNNGGDKLATIQGTQLVMEINTETNDVLNKLLRGQYSDKRYKTTGYINDRVFFRGFMLVADAEEPFIPTPTLKLVAVDGLGSLRNKPLVKPDGTNPTGYNKIIKYIAWCLQQTGQSLPINVAMNIRGVEYGSITDEPGNHFYNTHYLDAKTFEKEIGECEDSYTVLQKIFKHTCYIGMRHGEWWIKNVDEFDTQPEYVARFDAEGEWVDNELPVYYNKEIGIDENMKWSQESGRVSFSSPAKFAKDTFRYETPKEVPCNIEFLRGTIFSDTPTLKKYSIDCWTKLYKDGTGDHASAANMYIETQLINGYEINRYLHFEDNGVFNFIMSEGIPIRAGDRAEINVNRRMESNHGTGGIDNCVQLRLYGDDGTFWTHHGKNGSAATDAQVAYWVACDSLFQTNQKFHGFEVADDYDDTESTSLYSGEVGPVPVSGTIKMLIYVSALHGSAEDTYIEDASFEYLPYINGSFQKYTGQSHKVSANNDNDSVDEEIFMSDGPNLLTKGSLIRHNGTRHVLAGLFWNAAVFPGGLPSSEYQHPFAFIQILNVWNQVRLMNRIMRGPIQGIESDTVDALDRTDLPTIFHKYYMRDVDEHTNNKQFMLLNCDIDLYKCEFASSTFKEVYDEVIGKKYTDTYEFKYITQ